MKSTYFELSCLCISSNLDFKKSPQPTVSSMSTTTKCTVYLLSLTSSIQEFKIALAELPEEQKPLLTTKVIHWIFPPAIPSVDELTATTWDMVVCFKAPFSMPSSLSQMIKASWNISFDAPPAVLASLPATQSELATSVHPRSEELDLLTDSELCENDSVSSVDSAELTPSLKDWMQSFTQDQESQKKPQAIIMFNLLAFKDMERYKKYQQAFIAGAGTRHGARPLLYGEVVGSSRHNQGHNPWEMTAFVHYPSVLHFADMLCSSDYKEISHKYRKGSLVDNPLLCLAYV